MNTNKLIIFFYNNIYMTDCRTPKWDPPFWDNLREQDLQTTNCYYYAFNVVNKNEDPENKHKIQPGELTNPNTNKNNLTCKNIIYNIELFEVEDIMYILDYEVLDNIIKSYRVFADLLLVQIFESKRELKFDKMTIVKQMIDKYPHLFYKTVYDFPNIDTRYSLEKYFEKDDWKFVLLKNRADDKIVSWAIWHWEDENLGLARAELLGIKFVKIPRLGTFTANAMFADIKKHGAEKCDLNITITNLPMATIYMRLGLKFKYSTEIYHYIVT